VITSTRMMRIVFDNDILPNVNFIGPRRQEETLRVSARLIH
jgi:hypothetical protein